MEEEDAARLQEKKGEDRLLEKLQRTRMCRTAEATPLDLVNKSKKRCTGTRRTETAVESRHMYVDT